MTRGAERGSERGGAREQQHSKRRRNEKKPMLEHSPLPQQIDASKLFSFLSSLLSTSLSFLLPMHWSTGLRVTSPPMMARTSPALSWAIAVLEKSVFEELFFVDVEREKKIEK